jgi:predicted RecB family nuclease
LTTTSALPHGKTPCSENIELFDSAYLEDFVPADYIEDHKDEILTEEDIRNAQIKHNIAHDNAVVATKTLCAVCPILDECRERVFEAEKKSPIYGIVAGMTPDERKKMSKKAA